VSPSYFRAMRIQLIAGRPFTDQDAPPALPVVIVNDTMARRYWPGASPIGKRVKFNGANDPWMEVIGVIADVKHWGLDARVNPEIYLPLKMGFGSTMTYVIDSDLDGAALAGSVREQIRAIDPNLPVGSLKTMEEVASASVGSRRAGVLLVIVFGTLALLLAAAGIHGVMSHLVALRTPEIGVRMTLGATPSGMMALVLREGAIQAAGGLAIGLSGGVLLMRSFRSMLYGVEPADPLTLAVVGFLLLATALVACTIPARRAMNVDPVNALRGS
jgi:putative ABC transport system permease protein